MWGRRLGFWPRVWGIPIKGRSLVHSPWAPPIVLPSTGVKADVYLQCMTTLVMGGNGLSRPGGNLGLRV